jgi:hypothetical protein
VLSVGVPLAWMRQVSPDWQVASFVAPLGHKASSLGADWYWEGMAGIFGRYIRDERLAWVFGFFADVSSDDDFYVPYVGATWTIDQRDPALAGSAVRAHRRHFFPVGRGALRRHLVNEPGRAGGRDGSRQLGPGPRGGASPARKFLGADRGRCQRFSRPEFSGNDWQPLESPRAASGYVELGITFRPTKSGQQ